MINKLKDRWRWVFGYTVVFITPKTTYKVRHRIGRAPVMEAKTEMQKLRGASAKVIIFDEYAEETNDKTN